MHCVAGHIGLPLYSIRRRQLIWKTSSSINSVAKSVQHSEAYSRVVTTTASKICIFGVKLMLRRFQTQSLRRVGGAVCLAVCCYVLVLLSDGAAVEILLD